MKSMKTLIIFGISFLFIAGLSAQKPNKKEQRAINFKETLALIESRQFEFVADRAFPQGWQSIDMTTNYGFIKVNKEEAKANMPFFGRSYTAHYGRDGGIKFENKIKNEKLDNNPRRHRIRYVFECKSAYDTYQIHMDISSSGHASVSINCNDKSQISYNGKISPLEEMEE